MMILERVDCLDKYIDCARNAVSRIATASLTFVFVLSALPANAQTACASWGPAVRNINNMIQEVRSAIAAREREARTISAHSTLHALDFLTFGTPASSLRMACGFNPSACKSPANMHQSGQDQVRQIEQEIAQSRRNLASLERDRDRMQAQQQRDCAREAAAQKNAPAPTYIAAPPPPPPPPPAGPVIDAATATAIIGILGGVAGAINVGRGGGFPASPSPRCHHRPGASTQHCQ